MTDKYKHIRRKVVFSLAGLLVTLALTLAGALLYANTESGKRTIVNWANEYLSENEGGIVLGQLSGSLFSGFTLSELSILDGQGVWLRVTDATMKWSPLSLIRGNLKINSANIKQVNLMRLPKTSENYAGEDNEPSIEFDLPKTPVDIELKQFTAEEIIIGEGIVGSSAKFVGHGNVDYMNEGALVLQAELIGLGRIKDQISVNILYPDEDTSLTAEMFIFAPQGGFFGALAGIDNQYDMTAEFKGRGPIDNWRGQLTTKIGDVNIAKADIAIGGQSLSINAALDAGGYLSDEEAALFGSTATLKMDISPSDQDGRRDLSVRLLAETMKLDVGGALLTKELNILETLDFSVEITNAQPFNKLTAPLKFDAFSIEGTVSGRVSNPSIKFRLPRAVPIVVEDISTEIDGSFDVSLQNSIVTVSASGVLAKIEGASIEEFKPILAPSVNWSVAGSYNIVSTALEVDAAQLGNAEFEVSVSGQADNKFQAISADATAVIKELASLVPDANGTLNLIVDVDRPSGEDDLTANVRLATNELNTSDDVLNAILGMKPFLEGKFNQKPDGAVTIEDMRLTGALISAAGSADITANQAFENAVFNLSFDDLQKITPLAGIQFDGGIDIAVALSGPISSPNVNMETALNSLDLQTLQVQNLVLKGQVADVFNKPVGVLNAIGETNIGVLDASANINADSASSIFIPNLDVKIGEYLASGSLRLPKSQPIRGSVVINTQVSEDQTTSRFGTIEGAIELSDQSGAQKLEIDGTLVDINMPVGETDLLIVNNGSISSSITLFENNIEISGNLSLDTVSHPRLQASSILARAKREDGLTNYSLEAIGTNLMPYDLQAEGTIRSQGSAEAVTLSLEGSVAGDKINTRQPINISLSGGGYTVAPFILDIGEGEIGAEASSLKNTGVSASLDIKNISTTAARTFFPEIPVTGTIDGTANLQLGNENTEDASSSKLGDFDISFRDLYAVGNDLPIDQGVEMNIRGELSSDMLTITGSATLPAIVDADFSGAFPVKFDQSDNAFSLPPSEAIAGDLSWRGNVGLIWPVLGLVNHDISGKIDAELKLSGTYESPDVDGYINLNNGRYENAQTGFVASDITLETTVADRRFLVKKLSATDGGGGAVNANGFVQLHEDFKYNTDIDLILDKARLVRKPKLSITASSTLKFVSNGITSSVSGDVTVDSANIGVIERGDSDVIELNVREINGTEDDGSERDIVEASISKPIELNVDFRVPNQLFIRSYGMDSEWSADIKITGTSFAPLVAGNATLVRGTFDFSGKRFNLTRGNLTFTGERKIDPILDISAENQLPDLTAILTITGRASAPKIEVSSSPSLPQDEVLSRVFFGTSVADLSPVETVQLAATIHSLSTGGGQGLVGGIRRSLGIDRLSIGQSENRDYGTTITGGKYLTNNIYVEVTTAPATGETATAVEVGLTKNLSLITRRTLDHDNNLAIRWSWNY